MKTLTESLPVGDMQDLELMAHLFGLPHKILSHHDVDGLAPMILHELGHNNLLGINKAGYLIDNPDFNCLRGVAGFCSKECQHHSDDLWSNPHTFATDMQQAEFHQRCSTFNHHSPERTGDSQIDHDAMKEIGQKLGMQNPCCLTWKMKHGNNGILLFEAKDNHLSSHKDLLHNIVGLLSLC